MNFNKKTFHRSTVKALTTGALAVLLTAGLPGYDTDSGSFSYPSAYAKSCFIAGTKILMADGSRKRIETVCAGDLVVGLDGSINRVEALEKVRLAGRRLYSLNGRGYFVTAEHPFMTQAGWKAVDPAMTAREAPGLQVASLAVGDRLTKLAHYSAAPVAQGNLAMDSDARLQVREERLMTLDSVAADPALWVYNLLLDGSHSYFADGFLVHNKGGGSGGRSDGDSGRGSSRGGHLAGDDDHGSGQGRGRGRGRGGDRADHDDRDSGQGRGRGRGRGGHSSDEAIGAFSERDRGRGRIGGDDFNAAGLKLRGDGSIDDSQPGRVNGSDDFNAAGQKLRGDGSIDD